MQRDKFTFIPTVEAPEVSHRPLTSGVLCLIPNQTVCDIWWTKWQWHRGGCVRVLRFTLVKNNPPNVYGPLTHLSPRLCNL